MNGECLVVAEFVKNFGPLDQTSKVLTTSARPNVESLDDFRYYYWNVESLDDFRSTKRRKS